jgi:chromosome segregation ATPase
MLFTALPRQFVSPRRAIFCLTLAAGLGAAGTAQADVYTCTTAQGEYLTSDRLIVACLDREQRVLDSSGALRRVIEPEMTREQRARYLARQQQAQEAIERARDAMRRDQALLIRYPNQAAHDQARAAALAQSQTVIDAANAELGNLTKEQQDLNGQMTFYEKDPSSAPAQLRRQIEDNEASVQIQKQAIAAQEAERARINARYDAELATLRQLWNSAAQQQQQSAQAPSGGE